MSGLINPVVIDEVITKQVAALAITGANPLQISQSLSLSRYQVQKIMQSDKFKEVLKDTGDAALADARQVMRAQTASLAKEMVRVLKKQLGDDSLEAVKIGLKVLGIEQLDDKGGDTNISVVLPSMSESKKEDVTINEYEILPERDRDSDQ